MMTLPSHAVILESHHPGETYTGDNMLASVVAQVYASVTLWFLKNRYATYYFKKSYTGET